MKEFFIGIDSDGTVFDSMGRKHTQALIPTAIKIWGLQEIESLFFEIAEKINLYSKHRGINRFAGLALTFEQLEERLIKDNIDFQLPDFKTLSTFVVSGAPLSLLAFEEFAKDKDTDFVRQVSQWSISGDELYESLSKSSQPFRYVKESLQEVGKFADCAVISSAPTQALHKEWSSSNLLESISIVAGQEIGNKSAQLKKYAYKKYSSKKTLMLGDALGDLEAALENDLLFYPIMPGDEENSWRVFLNKVSKDFLNGEYTKQTQEKYIKIFVDKLK
jgi:phosphoglycolate phosphatase-like HAD superfamily hydrolase